MDLSQILGNFASILQIITVVIALLGWLQTRRLDSELEKERRRQAQLIQIVLKNTQTDAEIELPIRLRRSEVTRSEVQGLIGMVCASGERYTLAYLASPTFGKALEHVKASTTDDPLIIPCSNTEFSQFVLPTISTEKLLLSTSKPCP